jgi:AcrR family transcriptional regulator
MMNTPVKGKTEAGRRREARALDTRRRIVEAALRLFLDLGYRATTIDAIARQANVAPATVYQAFRTKYAILAQVFDVAVAGDVYPVAVLGRDWVQGLPAERDPVRRLEIVVHHTASICARTAEIKEVLRDAASGESEIRELIAEDTRRRHQTQSMLVQHVIDPRAAGVRNDHCDAVAIYFALVNSDTYQLMVGHLGWSFERWERWLVEVLTRQILEPAGLGRRLAGP